MVVHRIPQSNTIVIKTNDISQEVKKMETIIEDTPAEVPLAHWKNTFNMRPLTLAALTNGKSPNRSVQSPLSRMRCRTITNAAKSLDILRQNLQAAINKEIDIVIRKYLEKFFQPAIRNIRDNLGAGSVSEELIKEVCKAMLEEAKQMYCAGISVALNKTNPSSSLSSLTTTPEQVIPARKRKVSDTENESLQRKRVYPPFVKWDPTRVNNETQFILSTSANKVLGFGAIRGRLSTKHPELVKYMVDQDDREWLSTARVPGLIPGTPNISLMFLEDIVQIVNCDEYRNNPNLCLNELKGFGVPDFIQRKVRAYMTLMRTKYLPPVPVDNFQKPKNCVKPSKPFDQPIQMSVGVGVECVSSGTPLTLLDSSLIELESQFFSLTGLTGLTNFEEEVE